jgi:glucose-1-phosphate cytidylyltransferase
MKVVLFCGGMGTRLREHSETIPKPLVHIGSRPVIWHLMRYYAHFGHKEFILCLGYRGDLIREYFLGYNECLSNDFVLETKDGVLQATPLKTDLADWRITLIDTGLHSNLGQRLLRARPFLQGDATFLANYSDGLTDLDLNAYISRFKATGATAALVGVRPSQSLHAVRTDAAGVVQAIEGVGDSNYWINGGFFCFHQGIFDVINEGEELVEEPFLRLIQQGQLWSHRHEGYWAAMDTFKDKITLNRLEAQGQSPWMVWQGAASNRAAVS